MTLLDIVLYPVYVAAVTLGVWLGWRLGVWGFGKGG